jgi:hypothetical protein
MKRIFAAVTTTGSRARAAVLGTFLLAGLASFAEPAQAATAYYVKVEDVYARPRPQSYAMGRLYTDQRIDIQYIDSNGWGYGYAYGYVNRCVWVQYSYYGNVNFWTHGTTVSNKCRTTNMYLDDREFTNGEIWCNSDCTDGVVHRMAKDTHAWDNWAWGQGWGNHYYRGVSSAGSYWKIRYTTNDGVGVMARPCYFDSTGTLKCARDWHFILRSAL